MILLVAVLIGAGTGWLVARLRGEKWSFPALQAPWIVILAFLPQLLTVYLPATRSWFPDTVVSLGLILSQFLMLVFCWLNRRVAGIGWLALGLGLNFLVILANGGFMPISPQTAARLVPASVVQSLPLGARFGFGKDVLLLPQDTRLVWFSDRFLPPKGFPIQVAFSLGDVLIAFGAIWLLTFRGKPIRLFFRKVEATEQCNPRHSPPQYL